LKDIPTPPFASRIISCNRLGYIYKLFLAYFLYSDGRTVGACLDRNGLRPARYWRTSDGFVYVASEVGSSYFLCFLNILFGNNVIIEPFYLTH
jgi:hypothetical protein